MTVRRFAALVAAVLLLALAGLAGPAAAAPIFFDDRAVFDAAAGPLDAFEDFEDAVIPDGPAGPSGPPEGVAAALGPWDSTTDNGIFSPGDLVEGVVFVSVIDNHLVVLDDGAFGSPTKTLGPAIFADELDMVFPAGVEAVGFDLIVPTTGSSPVQSIVSLFDLNDVLIGSDTVLASEDGIFFGAIDQATPIGRIRISTQGAGDVIDNLTFGSPGSPGSPVTVIPAPGPLALLALGLVGLVGLRLVGRRAR